ncbi:NADH:ubiquinone reductase (Na(+)-transporting) subunit D [Limimaricola pyoseonensis]|uniref:Na+-transporting NADH:ubiquinone oxidoreductase subunit D n=1 Tax=Limimaricola pyoseonensis TaxID=521013 RepID=A0A1G7JLZ0_9RHOB|nr:NADH:ubiquinone reductase (Na(+)-transporting) subunit D [Limimaricola pyoseonensis]SDF25957.1 Na+-transporting NADH:ubiquinone oxidoreductase subunit D [Limimaricola pyoseonensis]
MSARDRLVSPLIRDNPVTRQILGICSALAVTTSMTTALTMSAALVFVLCTAAALISAIRRHIPRAIRLILQITIIATLVILVDELLRAYAFALSERLSIFVGLIVTNCLVLGRAEAFAMHHPAGAAVLDGLGNALGYGLVLMVVAAIRELLGTGALFGRTVLPLAEEGGWFAPLRLMQLAPAAFFVLGLLVWAIRSARPEQVERPEHRLAPEAEP